MQRETQTYSLIKWGVVAIDMVIMNLIVLAVILTSAQNVQEYFFEHSKIMFFTYNVLYVFCAGILVPPIIQMRNVRPENIVERVVVMLILFAVLSILTLNFICPIEYGFWPRFKFYALMLVCITSLRLILRWAIKQARTKGRNVRDVLYVGFTPTMLELYHGMMEDPSTGLRVKGYFNDYDNLRSPAIPYLGTIDQVYDYIEKSGFHPTGRVYCFLQSDKAAEIKELINYCENHLIRFYSVPNLRDYMNRYMQMELEGDIPVFYIREEPLRKPLNRALKRTFDICFSLTFLCTLFPFVYIIVGTITKLTSPGPVFFKQKRNGLNGEEFCCLKFRSMKVNAQSDTLQATEHDPRKTKFGDFLRRSSIDELPQFINVLRGEMSVVGPRPHMLKHTEEYSKLINKYMVRHLIKPGITGWAQVTGSRGETKELSQMETRVRKDIWYLEHWSIWLDLRIIYLTVRNGIFGDKNAF